MSDIILELPDSLEKQMRETGLIVSNENKDVLSVPATQSFIQFITQQQMLPSDKVENIVEHKKDKSVQEVAGMLADKSDVKLTVEDMNASLAQAFKQKWSSNGFS